MRDTIIIEKDAFEYEVFQKAKSSEAIKDFIEGKRIIKEIYVPRKVINYVLQDEA